MPDTGVGVIIARFQVDYLTPGHQALIKYVSDRHGTVVALLGVTPHRNKANPLTYAQRAAMVHDRYANIVTMPLLDKPSNAEWSADVDRLLSSTFPNRPIKLYSGRDGFLPCYEGKFRVESFTSIVSPTGTERRKQILAAPPCSDQFRAGVIYASEVDFPRAIPCIDVAVIRPLGPSVLVGRKASESGAGYRFIGGYVDPTDESLESTVKREVFEETDIEIANIKYVGSSRIADWRYRNSGESIISSLFMADYAFGNIRAKDDINELIWLHIGQLRDKILPIHAPLADLLLESLITTPEVEL